MGLNLINVEVAYAQPEKQIIIALAVESECTAQSAIQQSGIFIQFPEIDLANNKIGIFSKPTTLDTLLTEGDRVEIYRSLLMDPKQARKLRAQKQKKR